jgi:elongation factor Ts
MAEIPAALVKQLRERTGAGFMECKKALAEANGNLEEAETILRKHGIAVAQKKATREAKEGLVGTYVHTGAKLGVLVEVNCESDFVARTEPFQQLVHDIAMHIAAADPRYIRKEDVREEDIAKERDIQRGRALQEGKPEKVVDKIVEGRMSKFYEEICLYEQPFVKDNSLTVKELITNLIANVGENIVVSRMARFKVGEAS